MGIVAGLGTGISPHAASLEAQTEIERLFNMARNAALPRSRELKPWEPASLNERHLSMVMMRAGGMMQKEIAEILDVTDANVSVVLNHPDAKFLLDKLMAMKASAPTSIDKRIAALLEPAVDTLEELFDPMAEVPVVKRAPAAFKILESNGYLRKKVEVEHTHEFRAAPEQLAQLSKALRESREIPEPQTYEVQDAKEVTQILGGSPGGVGSSDPKGSAAPSGGGSQETTINKEAN